MAKLKKPLGKKAAKAAVVPKAAKKKRRTAKSSARSAEDGDDLPPTDDDDAELEAAMMDTEKLALEVTRAEEDPGDIDEDADGKIEPLPLPASAQVDATDDSSDTDRKSVV